MKGKGGNADIWKGQIDKHPTSTRVSIELQSWIAMFVKRNVIVLLILTMACVKYRLLLVYKSVGGMHCPSI